jgi:uncharacterized protein (DUF608 family)
MVGFMSKRNVWGGLEVLKPTHNEFRRQDGLTGLFYTSPDVPADSVYAGSMAFTTTGENVTYKTQWLDNAWWDGAHDFWDDFTADGRLEPNPDYGKLNIPIGKGMIKTGSLGSTATLAAGEEKTFQFVISWYFPNRIKRWEGNVCCPDMDTAPKTRNYYATKFADAWDAGRYLSTNLPRLEADSRTFHQSLFNSTLPAHVIDALAANITVLRSPTCFRLENGSFCGWEGCFDAGGCCHGTCTHVWNYTQTVAFLFPDLERSMRRTEFGLETDAKGDMAFRSEQVFGRERWKHYPAADGQNGTIIRFYRDWKLSGDNGFLKELWPHVRDAINFAFDYWDSDKDCVLDSQQHNTYDIEFYGPNSLSNSMFFGALLAGIEMAKHMGDQASLAKWQDAFAKGSALMDKLLWGGEYYIQQIPDVNAYRYQYGIGCLSDQLLGQFLAHIAGLGYVLPKEHVKKAMKAIFKYNFRSDLSKHVNVQRVYALNDEAGLLLATWPKGGRPRLPMVYSDEVWTGIEYQVAAGLIYEGLVDEGLSVVKAVRDRHDGYRRNPWSEFECGHHYARSMASWGLLPALSGFRYDMVKGEMSFAPAINADDFRCFWSTGKAWGVYTRKKDKKGKVKQDVQVLYGSLDGVTVKLD